MGDGAFWFLAAAEGKEGLATALLRTSPIADPVTPSRSAPELTESILTGTQLTGLTEPPAIERRRIPLSVAHQRRHL